MRHSSAAAQSLAAASAAHRYAEQSGCRIDEAAAAIAAGAGAGAAGGGAPLTRRGFLGSGLAAGTGAIGAVMLPSWLSQPGHPAAAARRSGKAEKVIIIGSGIAGLGCAYRLWHEHGIASEVYEYNAQRPGGRVYTLRGYFDQGQYAEEHGEFISSEHTQTRQLAHSFGLHLDNVNSYPPHTRASQYQFKFAGRNWSQATLDHDWHTWAWRLFYEAANHKAPWPTLHNHSTAWGRKWDAMSCTDWMDTYLPGGADSDFGRMCTAIVLDEYGGPVEETSALNLVYLLGAYDSAASGLQPKSAPQLSGTDEKWHIRGGNDQLISGIMHRLPAGTVRLGHRLVALASRGNGRWAATFETGGRRREVHADQVVLALPFTRLRDVELRGIDLPPAQHRAIHKMPLGSNSKIQLQFSRRVWNADGWTGNMYTDEGPQGTWETSLDQPGPHGILVALPGGAGGADLGRRYHLPSYYGPAPDAMVTDYLRCYEQFWPGITAAYTGKGYYAWSTGDPHIGGAYSYLKVGQYTAFNGIQGRQHGRLHFAGEHTSIDFQGFIEGALRTGYRCAKEIVG